MIMKLTTEDEFNYYKWRDNYIIIQGTDWTTIHQSHCNDVNISSFRDSNSRGYFTTQDLADGMERYQAERCQNCCQDY